MVKELCTSAIIVQIVILEYETLKHRIELRINRILIFDTMKLIVQSSKCLQKKY